MPIATEARFPIPHRRAVVPRYSMLAFALTIFAGAFLLFQVQPLIGKYILPWFGGSPGVWTTCMLFFQMLLLGGYAYAHTVSRRLKPRTQAILHVILLLAALATLPITPGDQWKPKASGDPTWHILALLLVSLGLPYLVLASTGPLMQEWFRRTTPGASPYRLYALSNVGSLLALVSYPFYFETQFTRKAQAQFWSWGMLVYAICCGFCAYRLWRRPPVDEKHGAEDATSIERPRFGQRLLWICLPACASILLLAVTNKMCQDVAVIPFLWVLPLALYLLTFIISFDGRRWYSRFYYTIVLVAAMAAVCVALFQGTDMAIQWQVVIYSATLFVGCMVCHGELYHLKPHPKYLTSFYLMIAAGGAVGGLFVALVAPAIFNNFYEMHLSLALVVLLLVVLSLAGKHALSPQRWRWLFIVLALGAGYGFEKGLVRGINWLRGRDGMSVSPKFDYRAWMSIEKYHWAFWVVVAALIAVWIVRRRRNPRPVSWHVWANSLLVVALLALGTALGIQIHDTSRGAVVSARNFYGVLSVFEYEKDRPESRYYLLQHGRITHGLQFASPYRAKEITSYFGPTTGLGLAFRQFPRQENKRIGLLGLGVGTIAAYAKPGDYLRIYEINPQVKDIAEKPFTYLARSDAKIDVVMGDGRLSMENEPPQNFDILIMDAFSSDAVPVHLLTKEAFEIYQRHLKPDGAILVNISNRYLDLRPVVENAAKTLGYDAYTINSEDGGADENDDGGWWLYSSTWMILSQNKEFMNRSPLKYAALPPVPNQQPIPLWTDDYTSIFRILQE
jgi:hypothetical protein